MSTVYFANSGKQKWEMHPRGWQQRKGVLFTIGVRLLYRWYMQSSHSENSVVCSVAGV